MSVCQKYAHKEHRHSFHASSNNDLSYHYFVQSQSSPYVFNRFKITENRAEKQNNFVAYNKFLFITNEMPQNSSSQSQDFDHTYMYFNSNEIPPREICSNQSNVEYDKLPVKQPKKVTWCPCWENLNKQKENKYMQIVSGYTWNPSKYKKYYFFALIRYVNINSRKNVNPEELFFIFATQKIVLNFIRIVKLVFIIFSN